MDNKKRQMRSTVFSYVVVFLILSASCLAYEKEIKNMSLVLAENIAKAGRKTIAVVDFNDLQGNVTELGRFFAEEFSVALASASKGFEVVDRTNLKSILVEHKLSTTGIIDPQTARKLGQIAGVDSLITGTITPFGDTIRLSTKILDTNTAKVVGATSGDIAKTKAIEELLTKEIEMGGSGRDNTPSHSTQRSNSKSTIKAEANNFTFEFKKCIMSGTKIVCEALITNNEKDRKMYIRGAGRSFSPRIIDNNGYEYKPATMTLGSSFSEALYTDVESVLVTGIPTVARFTFNDVSTQPRFIALLDIPFSTDEGDFRGQLRNLPITEK